MLRALIVSSCLISTIRLCAQDDKPAALPSFTAEIAYKHELKPHRHTIPVEGIRYGSDQIGLTLTVSPAGDVIKAVPRASPEQLKLWPKLQAEIYAWKFAPFEVDGSAVTANVDEYVDLVPPERFPTTHIPAPSLRPNSTVSITLQRGVCYGRCPAYSVTVSTHGTVFDGGAYVTATGKHTAPIPADDVRKLAQRFIDADFYSMASEYRARVTDNPTYILSITVDGHTKSVVDYVGSSVGMPALITDLEDSVDSLANTAQWIH